MMSNHNKAIFLVLMSGIVWSFGAVVVKSMIDPQLYQLPYLIIRGLTVASIISVYLLFNDKIDFIKNLLAFDKTTIVGGLLLTSTFIGFIYSITNTTAAVTLLMFALIPFLASIIAFILIKEKISKKNLIAMLIALSGVIIMVFQGKITGSLFGLITGLIASIGFAGFTVMLRKKNDLKKFYILVYAGIFCAIFSFIILMGLQGSIYIPLRNILLSLLHGTIVGSGLILYSIGSKKLLSGELTLLSLLEVIGGILWAWVPFLGVNETPGFYTLVGGFIICISIMINSANFDVSRLRKQIR
ncbi:MAG: EamA family transporter [Pelagibacteraceae bacterium]|nr:EamA family transporter [Pelagibacteraceae bacterium]